MKIYSNSFVGEQCIWCVSSTLMRDFLTAIFKKNIHFFYIGLPYNRPQETVPKTNSYLEIDRTASSLYVYVQLIYI